MPTGSAAAVGVGGVLIVGDAIVSWFAEPIQPEDLRRFQAKRGQSAYNTWGHTWGAS